MKILLTGWKGGTLGFRVGIEDRKLFRGLTRVKLELPIPYGESCKIEIRLSPSFWRKCPELRCKKIGKWMGDRGDYPWPKGHPPKYEAEMIEDHLRLTGL